MARNGITGEAADGIVRSITSFALYGFPESHAASFALIVYASAYLKVHYPAAFYTALLNNQPMGFYHPATLVKDAQRHGVRFAPIDVQRSDWRCRVEQDGRVRLGLMYVRGLRAEVGQRIARRRWERARRSQGNVELTPRRKHVASPETTHPLHACDGPRCPGCGRRGDDRARRASGRRPAVVLQRLRARVAVRGEPARFRSLDHWSPCRGARRDELATLAEIGALNAFGSTAVPRCGRSSARCGRRGSCSRKSGSRLSAIGCRLSVVR